MSDASNPAPRPSVVAPRVAAATPGDVTISSSSPAATNELRPRSADGRFVRVAPHEEALSDLPSDRFLG